MGSLFFSDGAKDFSEEYNNIFVPVEEETQSPESSSPEEQTDAPNSVAISQVTFPKYGEQFGELIIEDCQINARLFSVMIMSHLTMA